jgi:diguanylate cyclase (GGDEF)-like protein
MPDKLTGLRMYSDDLREQIETHPAPSCLIDVDGLIWVNDQYGPQTGDRVLIAVARELTDLIDPGESEVFRVGGDEFLLLHRSLDRTKVRENASRIVSIIRAIGFPYRRTDRPHRRVAEVNVALLPVTPGFASRAFGKGGLTDEARKWVSGAVWQEKQRTGRDAGIVVDLLDADDCPWAADDA